MRRVFDGIFVLSLLLALAAPASAQTFGQITGAVTDTSGAVLVGASVTVTNTADQRRARGTDQQLGQLCVSKPAPRHIQRQSRPAGLSEQDPERHRAAGAANGPSGFLAGSWLGGGGGRGDRQRADDQRHGCDGRHRHREQTDPGVAAQWPQLHQPGVAQSERQLRLRRRCRRRSQRQTGRRPLDPEFLDRRAASRIQPVHARRHRQSGCELQHVCLPALDRQRRGVQGTDRRLLGRIRARGGAGQRLHQERHERVSRDDLRVHPQRRVRRGAISVHFCQASDITVQMESVPASRWEDRFRFPACSTARTSCSSCRTSKGSGSATSRRSCSARRLWRCATETSPGPT